MNVLVTGSAGYVGPVVVRALRAAGHTVVGYDIGWFGDDKDANWFVRGDIREPLVHPMWPDAVVHLAGLSNDPMGDLDPALTYDVNVSGTLRSMMHFRSARHVVISSCAVYGVQTTPADEEAQTNPQTQYAWAKEQVDFAAKYPEVMGAVLPEAVVSLRLGTVFGPAPNHRLDLVVNRMVFDALNSGGVTVMGDAARPLVHVEDVASAVVWAVEGDQRGIYNIIGENVRMKALGKAIARYASVPVKYLDGGADTRDYMASGEKALRAGWSPTRSVGGSLPALFEHTRPLDIYDLPNHVRLAQLQRLIDEGQLDPKTLRNAA